MFIIQCPILSYAKVCALPSARSSSLHESGLEESKQAHINLTCLQFWKPSNINEFYSLTVPSVASLRGVCWRFEICLFQRSIFWNSILLMSVTLWIVNWACGFCQHIPYAAFKTVSNEASPGGNSLYSQPLVWNLLARKICSTFGVNAALCNDFTQCPLVA